MPIEIVINENTSTLVISGANTGGKTVALKTLGLLTLMALSGIPIPADEGSEAVIFTAIFADIGDRQDIIASLSTFSAHVKRLKEFLLLAGRGSLVLIDEIGVGTDPSEGSALALAALETLKKNGAVTVVTTHHNLLKAQAQIDPAYMNASVEFDESSLQPLYRLHYGIPGPSLGLMIAESLGIPSELISRARLYIKEKEGAFIESVRLLEEEKEKISRMKDEIAALEVKWKAAVERLTTGRELILKKAQGKADLAIEDARREFKEAIEKFKEEKAASPAARARAEERVRMAAKKALERLGDKREQYVPAIGDNVVIMDSNTKGVVIRTDANAKKAELQAGNIKVWVDFDRLEKKGEEKKPKFARSRPSGFAEPETRTSVNVIGTRVDEALAVVTRFLDDAHAAGLDSVEIIHGIGTGALSKAIHELLSKSGIVKNFHHADPKRGGGGVTVVEMA
ncbi:MAG: Smr/MutS family protein [Deltaproteobacteria bacterium]|nr:Smr/MutS family protein [Deltaproteobacteria bacterium]